MSKKSIGIGAFMIGTLFGLLSARCLQFVSASTSPSQSEVPTTGRNIFSGSTFIGGIKILGAAPEVPPINKTPVFEGAIITSAHLQQLDGLDCRMCTFDNSALVYSGGAFNLKAAKFTGTTHISLAGAAANTVAFLQFMHGIDSGIPSASLPPSRPIERKAAAKKPMTNLDVTAPFIGPQ